MLQVALASDPEEREPVHTMGHTPGHKKTGSKIRTVIR